MKDIAKIRSRIRKLLALAKSQNEHEASNAYVAAAALMELHNIRLDSPILEAHEEEWLVFLLESLGRYFGCEIHKEKDEGFFLLGDEGDISTIRLVFPYIADSIDDFVRFQNPAKQDAFYDTAVDMLIFLMDAEEPPDDTDEMYNIPPGHEPPEELSWSDNFLLRRRLNAILDDNTDKLILRAPSELHYQYPHNVHHRRVTLRFQRN